MLKAKADSPAESAASITLRSPRPEDGSALHALVASCPPLDPNSRYCNLLQCSHFADTAIAAELDGELAGFISGYIPPGKPDTIFVWQVAVSDRARGQGLGVRMLSALVRQPACAHTTHMETTITPDNAASWALFRRFARDHGAEVSDRVFFDRDRHFGGRHDSEHLLRIGPIHRDR